MIKAVFFDMDGVITNTEYLHFLSWKKAFSDKGYYIDYDMYPNTLQARSKKIGISNIITNPSDEIVSKISHLKMQYYEEFISGNIDVYEDAITLIKQLHKMEIITAVVSASCYAEQVIKRVGLSEYFSIVISGTRDKKIRNKPYPDIYLDAMSRLGVLPSESIIIEDSVSGIQSGIATGAKVVGVCRQKITIDPSDNLNLVSKLDISDLFL